MGLELTQPPVITIGPNIGTAALGQPAAATDVGTAAYVADGNSGTRAALAAASIPVALQPWRAALANRDNATAHIWIVGDSNVEGHGATQLNRTFARRLAPTLNKRAPLIIGTQPTGGRGFVPSSRTAGLSPSDNTDGVVNTGGSILALAGYGVNDQVCQMTASGHKQVYTVSGSHFQIAYTSFAAAGTGVLYYKIDAGGAVTIDTGTLNKWGNLSSVISLGTPGAHTVEVGWNSGAAILLNGIIEYYGDSASGVMSHLTGIAGTFANSWNGVSNWGLTNADTASKIGAQCVVLMTSINDSSPTAGNRTAAQFQGDMTTYYAFVRSKYVAAGVAVPSMVHAFEFKPNGAIVDPGGYEAYLRAAYNAATTDANAIVLDLTKRLPTNTGAGTWYYDGFHPNNLGYAAISDLLTDFLMPN